MNCPKCNCLTKTKDSRTRNNSRFRRRICKCGNIFTTVEVIYVPQKKVKIKPKPKKVKPKKKPKVAQKKIKFKGIPLNTESPDWVRRIAEKLTKP